MIEGLCVRNLGEMYLLLGKATEGERTMQRARAIYAKSLDEGAAFAVNIELQLARLKWWSGDVAAAREIFLKVKAQQAAAAGRRRQRRHPERERAADARPDGGRARCRARRPSSMRSSSAVASCRCSPRTSSS